ncbi:thermonuclease family protein [Patescibacteria group bacterium]|nr:thermonuclease family protein [Patescibacteria group bacterium]MBU1123999.1 thermonuclease family protein [Patescibacteria group bacterium]
MLKIFHLTLILIILTACTSTKEITKETSPEPTSFQTTINRVVDGDTVTITLNGVNEYVRIIGIDAPEKDECFADESSEALKKLIEGKNVILETKPSEDRDDYKRLLRYIRSEGVDVGAQMIEEGYAKDYPWFPHPRNQTYKELERQAEEKARGLWERCD